MAKYGFNSISVEDGEKSLTNADILDFLAGRFDLDDDTQRALKELPRDYHGKGRLWASIHDEFDRFIPFDIVIAGFACTSPDLHLSLKCRTIDHTANPRVVEVDNSEVQEFAITSDGLLMLGTITVSEQLFTLTRLKVNSHKSTIVTEGWDWLSTYHLAYCEPFKPNEPVKVIIIHTEGGKSKLYPKLNQAELEAELGPVCVHGNPVGTCEEMFCSNRQYKPYEPPKTVHG